MAGLWLGRSLFDPLPHRGESRVENLVKSGRMADEGHLWESDEHPALHHNNGDNHVVHEVHCYVLVDDFQLDAMIVVDITQDALWIAQRVDLEI